MQTPTPTQPSKVRLCAEIIVKIIEYFYPPVPPHKSSLNISQSVIPLKAGCIDRFQFSDFVPVVRNARLLLHGLPVTTIESYHKTGQNIGLVPHRYSILTTVCHPHGGSTYLKLQLRATEYTLRPILTAKLADDRSALICPCNRRLTALELTPPHTATGKGPSLDTVAKLLDIIHKRTGERYNVGSQNCLWLTDLILFGSAMKFKEAWLAEGQIFPDWPMRGYLHGQIDVLATSMQCFLPEGAPVWMGIAYGALGRVFGGFDMQSEVDEVVGMWCDCMDVVSMS